MTDNFAFAKLLDKAEANRPPWRITTISYVRRTTFLPLAIPLLAFFPIILIDTYGWRVPTFLSHVIAFSFMGALIAGPIYLVMMGIMYLIIRKRSWLVHLAAACLSPLLFAFILSFYFVVHGDWESTLILVKLCLVIGYGCVIAALIGLYFIHRSGHLTHDNVL